MQICFGSLILIPKFIICLSPASMLTLSCVALKNACLSLFSGNYHSVFYLQYLSKCTEIYLIFCGPLLVLTNNSKVPITSFKQRHFGCNEVH